MEIMEYEAGVKLIARYIHGKNIIPIFGAGLTVGCIAKFGKVSDSESARTQMIDFISVSPKVQITKEELSDQGFNTIANYFNEYVEFSTKANYYQGYYTEVKIVDTRKIMLDFPWISALTLNIDDGIENSSDFTPVLPYRKYRNSDQQVKRLYKIHGDALEDIKYENENESVVFSDSKYLELLSSDSNKDMLNTITAIYSEMNILYFGCSLNNEPDLKSIYNKIKMNKNKVDRFWITDKIPSDTKKMALGLYGVNKIIIVDDYAKFCKELFSEYSDILKHSPIPKYGYTDPSVLTLSPNDSNDPRISKCSKKEILEHYPTSRIFDEEKNQFTLGSV